MACPHRCAIIGPGIKHLIDCTVEGEHASEHNGRLYATQVTWLDGDRRDFTGEFIECPVPHCILPAGHRGNDAF